MTTPDMTCSTTAPLATPDKLAEIIALPIRTMTEFAVKVALLITHAADALPGMAGYTVADLIGWDAERVAVRECVS